MKLTKVGISIALTLSALSCQASAEPTTTTEVNELSTSPLARGFIVIRPNKPKVQRGFIVIRPTNPKREQSFNLPAVRPK